MFSICPGLVSVPVLFGRWTVYLRGEDLAGEVRVFRGFWLGSALGVFPERALALQTVVSQCLHNQGQEVGGLTLLALFFLFGPSPSLLFLSLLLPSFLRVVSKGSPSLSPLFGVFNPWPPPSFSTIVLLRPLNRVITSWIACIVQFLPHVSVFVLLLDSTWLHFH